MNRGIMSCQLAMPTEDELAEMSYSQLNQGSLLACFLWQEQRRLRQPTAEYWQVCKAYTTEQNKRLKRGKKDLR